MTEAELKQLVAAEVEAQLEQRLLPGIRKIFDQMIELGRTQNALILAMADVARQLGIDPAFPGIDPNYRN